MLNGKSSSGGLWLLVSRCPQRGGALYDGQKTPVYNRLLLIHVVTSSSAWSIRAFGTFCSAGPKMASATPSRPLTEGGCIREEEKMGI